MTLRYGKTTSSFKSFICSALGSNYYKYNRFGRQGTVVIKITSRASRMKFFLAILLVACAQAFSIKNMIEREAFDLLVSQATSELETMAVKEVESALTAEGLHVTPFERSVIHKVSTMVGETIKSEMTKIVSEVTTTGDFKMAVAQRIIEKLRDAAEMMADGLHMDSETTEAFFHELMKDIEALEKSSLFEEGIEKMFDNLFEKIMKAVTYDAHQKRDLIDIFEKINDTLRRIVGHLHGKFHDLHDFLHQAISHGKEQLKPHIENIKTLAKTFIDHINLVSAKVAQQALEFFKPWASKLGQTWTTLVKDIHERLQKLHATAIPIY
ncbi:Hypothetical predicted protein [Octopus vulgaris]|uniref:Uncharacterized protein n=1 Tax=Octopus vulgaris TaxID=6645 RepID=A0AA36BNC0_OCTVU|nr:Hypothetical predicted protein [Octopus vulgaris]